MTENGIALIEVVVSIAVSDTGVVRCCPFDSCNVQIMRRHKEFMDDLKDSSRLWTVKTVKTKVPLPVQAEDIDV